MGACHCIGPTNARRQPGLSRARVRLPKDLLICIMYEYIFYVNVVYMLLYDVIWFLKWYYIEWYIFCMQLIINDKLYFGCLPLPSMPVENESVKPKISSRKKICHSGGGQWNRRGTHPTSGAQNGGMKANCILRHSNFTVHQNLGRAFAGRSCKPTLQISASSTVMLSLLPFAFSYYVAEDYCVNSRVFSPP